MNAFGELWRAIIGWLDLLTARPGAAEKFNLGGIGLVNATGCYFAVVLLLIAVYRLSDITMGVMANPFYLDMGFGEERSLHVFAGYRLFHPARLGIV